MIIRSSQIRQLFRALASEPGVQIAIPEVFQEAFTWSPVKMELVTLNPYAKFNAEGMGIEVYYDGIFVGTWRPGTTEPQETICPAIGLAFRFSIDTETHLLKIESCKE